MPQRATPNAAVTFLFTDIEGSTRAWELHPREMTVALEDHNRLLQETLGERGGYVFKTVGDAFCCAFTDSPAALTAAVEAMRRLTSHAWPPEIGELRVRMALHTGLSVERGGDYFGPTVNRVARLLSIAHGGQILLSSAMAEVLENIPLSGVTLRDLGLHRLKDLKRAEATYQVVVDGLPADFPALASLDAHPNNLPSQISTFVGRSDELARLRRGLSECRVITIAGPGGIGKTRLALQAAAEAVQDYNGGTFFVPLAPITAGSLVVNALASVLGLTELSSEPIEATVLRYIDGKKMMLVFDNCEHVLAETALLVKHIVSECASARCIVTGREPLHLTGEHVERLSPLSTPAAAQTVLDLEALDASRLFLERARSVAGTDLALSARDCALVVEICRRLDGIPLALELAASRLATIPLPRLAQTLSSMRLASKDATIEERHRTLRAAIEWSYTMLDAAEKRAFLALSVFRGGCTLEALQDVAQADIDDEVASLIDKSLAQLDLAKDRDPRYRLLQPMAEFAEIELEDDGSSEAFRGRHVEYYGALASSAANASGTARRPALSRIDDDIDNVRAALTWSAGHDPERAAQVVLDLTPFWRARGSFTEGRSWLERVLALSTELDSRGRAAALRQTAGFAAMQDDYPQAIDLAQRALEIYRALGDEAGIGSALHIVAEVAHRRDDLAEAERLYRESLEHLDAGGHLLGKTICLMNVGALARDRGDYAESQMLLSKANAGAEALADRNVWAQVHIERAWTTLFAGDTESADAAFKEAFEAKSAERDTHGACQARLGIATAALMASRTESALREYEIALAEATALKAPLLVIDAIYGIAAVCATSGELVAAAKCYGLASSLTESTRCGTRNPLVLGIANERMRAGLTDEERARAISAGAAMRAEDVALFLAATASPAS